MWLIGTEQQCVNYDEKVTASENYYNGDNWANPEKHPTLNIWRIEKLTWPRNYEPDDVMTEVAELDETWKVNEL